MIVPGPAPAGAAVTRNPVKPDRWLAGLLAGLALVYLAGKLLGLGQPPRADPAGRTPKA